MKRTEPPPWPKLPIWWTAFAVAGALGFLAFWVVVIVVAWHFVAEYW